MGCQCCCVRGRGHIKQEVGRTSLEVPQGRGIFYREQSNETQAQRRGRRRRGRGGEGLGGVQKCREAITYKCHQYLLSTYLVLGHREAEDTERRTDSGKRKVRRGEEFSEQVPERNRQK